MSQLAEGSEAAEEEEEVVVAGAEERGGGRKSQTRRRARRRREAALALERIHNLAGRSRSTLHGELLRSAGRRRRRLLPVPVCSYFREQIDHLQVPSSLVRLKGSLQLVFACRLSMQSLQHVNRHGVLQPYRGGVISLVEE